MLGGTRGVRANGGCCGKWKRGGKTLLYKGQNPSLSSLFYFDSPNHLLLTDCMHAGCLGRGWILFRVKISRSKFFFSQILQIHIISFPWPLEVVLGFVGICNIVCSVC